MALFDRYADRYLSDTPRPAATFVELRAEVSEQFEKINARLPPETEHELALRAFLAPSHHGILTCVVAVGSPMFAPPTPINTPPP